MISNTQRNDGDARFRERERVKSLCARTGKLMFPVPRAELRVGDVVRTAHRVGRVVYGGMTGTVLKLAPRSKSALIQVRYQPAPNGPVHVQQHKVPVADLDFVERDETVSELVD